MMSKIKATVLSEFANLEIPYPMSEWAKGLAELYKSGGKFVFYQGRRRTNFLNYYLLEKALKKSLLRIDVDARKLRRAYECM